MKKFVKRAASTVALTTLAVSMLSGCGGSSEENNTEAGTDSGTEAAVPAGEGITSEIDMTEEPYTVAIQVVTLPGTQFEGEAEREEAINAITVPAINAKVDIQEVWISEVVNETSMNAAGGEKMDLIHVATVNPLSALVGSDMLYDMNTDNLLQNRGQNLVSVFGDSIDAGYVNGKQLAVPAKNFVASGKGI